MKKIAADLAYTLREGTEPTVRPVIEIDDTGKILGIGQYQSSELSGSEEEGFKINGQSVEYHRGILTPGFVNAHCHIELSHLKGAFREATGMSGFINQINALRESVDQEGRMKAMDAQFRNLSKQGVVAVSDISNCNESFTFKKEYLTLTHSESNPLFPVYYRTFVELFGTEREDAENILAGGQRIADQATQMGLDACVTPHSCYTMSPKLLEITAKRGLQSGLISYHSQESQEEEDMISKGSGALADNYRERGLSTPPVTGKTALEYFIDRISPDGETIDGKINLVHNVVLSQRSIDRAKKVLANPFFTICPLSNIFIHRALPPIGLMMDNGLKICLGTDSLSSNHILNMVREMECLQQNFPDLTLGQMLEWACRNGAEMLGRLDTIGTLDAGKTPGIVLIEATDGSKITSQTQSRRIA